MGCSICGIYRKVEARIFLFVRGWGIVCLINDSTNKMVRPSVLAYT